MKVRKALVKVISYGSVTEKLRVTMYNFCSSFYRVKEENLKTNLIPEDLRFPNSEFMLVWEQKSWKLIGVERLNNDNLDLIKKIIEKYEQSLDYLDLQENQEIEGHYLQLTGEFFNRIVEINYEYGIVSDKSCLDYFTVAFGTTLENYQEKIKLYYGIDVSDLIECRILDILKKIDNKNYSS